MTIAFTPSKSFEIEFYLKVAPHLPAHLYGFKTLDDAKTTADQMTDSRTFSMVQIIRVEKRSKFGPWIREVDWIPEPFAESAK
jgi:hypothetical protein